MGFIPVIEFGDCGLDASDELFEQKMTGIGETLYDALKTYGFAYLRNPGISQEDVDIVNAVTEKFFLSSLEEKSKYSRRPDNHGYISLRSENLNPLKPFDFKEAFNVQFASFDDPKIDWPSNEFSNTLKGFMEKCKLLSLKILKVLGVGMHLVDPDHFAKKHSVRNKQIGNPTTMRTIYYPPLPDLEDHCIRLGAHSDYGSITLLFQDSIGGLQVQNLEGKFVDAVHIDNTVLINIGDLLQFWSQNKLKSTVHRVVNVKDAEKCKRARRSLAYFVHPDNDVLVDEELIYEGYPVSTSQQKTKETGLTAHEYLLKKFAQTH